MITYDELRKTVRNNLSDLIYLTDIANKNKYNIENAIEITTQYLLSKYDCSHDDAYILCKEEIENHLKSLDSTHPRPIEPPKPKCPTCNSTNIKKISTGSRLMSVGVFGLASSKIGKTMECKNCGYKW